MHQRKSFKDQIANALSSSPYLAQQKLKLETERGRVVLRGVVNSFYQKQMAQEAVRNVERVKEIDNELQVQWG